MPRREIAVDVMCFGKPRNQVGFCDDIHDQTLLKPDAPHSSISSSTGASSAADAAGHRFPRIRPFVGFEAQKQRCAGPHDSIRSWL